MLFFQYLAKLLASLKYWVVHQCSLAVIRLQTWPNMKNSLPSRYATRTQKALYSCHFLTDFIQILQMFIIWGNDNLSKISGKLEWVPWPLPENWHGMILKGFWNFSSYEHWTSIFVFSTLCLFAHEIWQRWSGWYDTNRKEKASHKKAASFATLVVWFSQETNFCSNHSISQGIDGFVSFQEIKIVSMFVIFQIVACLRTKFVNVEAIDRLQIRKKTYLAKRHLHREHW